MEIAITQHAQMGAPNVIGVAAPHAAAVQQDVFGNRAGPRALHAAMVTVGLVQVVQAGPAQPAPPPQTRAERTGTKIVRTGQL